MPSLKAMAQEAQKTPKVVVPNRALNRKQPVFKSTERVADSDLESETESESENDSDEIPRAVSRPVTQLNGQKPKPVARDEGIESEEEDEQEDASISRQNDRPSYHDNEESESGSSKGSNSEDRSDEEQERGNAGVAKEIISSHIEETIPLDSHNSKALPVYIPPDGFVILEENHDERQRIAEVFGQQNLAGKQLWYITAPASIPISAVRQVSLRDVQLGRPALSFGGCSYGFVEDQVGGIGFTKILIPEADNSTYRMGPKAVDQTLHLQQIVQLHKNPEAHFQNSDIPVTNVKKSVRKQPEGLKMRFRPIGFGSGKTGTIGMSSSSDVSSSTDSDTDENTEKAATVSQQSFDQANTSQNRHASNAIESHDRDSSEHTGDGSSSVFTERKSPDSPIRPLKRKLSVFKREEKTGNTSHNQLKANSKSFKTMDTTNTALLSQALASKMNNKATSTKNNVSYFSLSKMPQDLSSRAEENASGLADTSITKATSILPPRQSSILPPSHICKSLDAPRRTIMAERRSDISLMKPNGTQSLSEHMPKKGLDDHDRSIDQTPSKKEQKQALRRLKKEASRKSQSQGGESINDAVSDTNDMSVNASSMVRKDHQHALEEVRPPTKPSTHKDSSQNGEAGQIKSSAKDSRKTKKYSLNSKIHDEIERIPKANKTLSTANSSPRKNQ